MLTLNREFEMLKMKESESVKDYSSKLLGLVNQMRLYGETVEDYKVVEKMLISLPKKFEAKVAAIEDSCDLKKMTISEMCNYCKKWGHRENFCRSKQNQSQQQPAQQANFTDEQPEAGDHLFMVSQGRCSASKDVWYVDSGCTSHMVKDSSLFTSLDNTDRTNVKLGNGEMVQATGKGTVSVHTSNGLKLIHDVLLVPELDQNLLSVAQLLKKGYSCSFKDKYCTIVDSCGVEVVKVGMHNNSFPLNLEQVNHSAFVFKHDDSALWHKRYGHFNMDALKYLQEHDMVRDMQVISRTSDDLCDACQLGKMHRKSFSSENVTRAKNKLELVHTDLCGPMSVPSYNQNKAVQGKTPIEAWSRVKPAAKHLKTFGSICYTYIADAKRSKLDDKAEMGIFLGYASNSKGYRVFNLQTKRVIISRDIQVDEDAYWDWENEQIQRSVKSSQLTTIPTATDSQDQVANDIEDEEVESGSLVLKTKSLAEIYEKCNFAPSLLDCNHTRFNVLSKFAFKVHAFAKFDTSWSAATNQAIWIGKVLTDLNYVQEEPTVIWCDNISAISMAKNPIQHGRTKHINVKFHAIREVEKNGEIQLVHYKSEEQQVDILTKALAGS
ncbi:hypothetical protein EZV62_018647 [Acer yangbiense]|uniref:Uncharacterized protein n=1 Tax=Acer yangbiense TaxID=1000413 RepID=A0A5C7HKA6_9ROSI|nr:hypothetical protein EZV62_018647 [Acer yangbiense]